MRTRTLIILFSKHWLVHRNGLSKSATVFTTDESIIEVYCASILIDACMYTDPGALLKANTPRNQVIAQSPLSEFGLSLKP